MHCTVDPREKILATCSTDGKIIIWTIATGQILKTLKGGHTEEVTSCSFCSIGPILASSSRDKKVILWNYDTGKRASRLGKLSLVLLSIKVLSFLSTKNLDFSKLSFLCRYFRN